MLRDLSPLATHVLENPFLRIAVIPQAGGKIASCFDLQTRREWLWTNSRLPVQAPIYGASYVRAHDSGGFDECFPAVAEGPYPVEPWHGVGIPDHGELWGLPWECEVEGRTLRMGVDGVRFPYRFERELELAEDAPELRLRYRVQNRAPFAFPFIWSSHPLLSIRPGMRLLIPDGTPMKVYGGSDPAVGDRGASFEWPMLAGQDLGLLPGPEAGYAVKIFGDAPARGWVGLHDPETATTLRMEYDLAEIPQLGLWLNMGGWTPFEGEPAYYNLGLEPCIGAGDDLELAMRQFGSYGCLPAKGELTWNLTLRLVSETLA